MSALLPFHKTILEEIHDPANSDLLILARGLGLRRILCTLMKIYDGPTNLVLLVNAIPEEESAIGEELGIMGCRKPGLRVVGYEMGSKKRQSLYKKGGLISVTSRILAVDMLQGDIPTHLITGLLVLHAEKVTPLVLEAFIVRLFREKNKDGFVKAFTDQPEHIISGLSPLKNIMKELQLRGVHIFPRFQEDVKKSLERRRADVVELSQELTEAMSNIHHAIIQCMNSTLQELKRSNTTLDLEELSIDNAYFRSFDLIVRKQLDPVWHKVGPKTKQLVGDLGTLRRLLSYLLTYDALAFNAYLESLISSSTSHSGGPKIHHSPWMLTDAANVIFQEAKRRCYVMSERNGKQKQKQKQKEPEVIDLVDDEDAWAALDEIEGTTGTADKGKDKMKETAIEVKGEEEERPSWLPDGMNPVLEELPKWTMLADVLQEAEEEMIRLESLRKGPLNSPLGNNIVLIMASSARTCAQLTEFLSCINHSAPRGAKGRMMMMRRLSVYLWWKSRLGEGKTNPGMLDSIPSVVYGPYDHGGDGEVSEALKKKDEKRQEKAMSRRRVRGGAPVVASSSRRTTGGSKNMVIDQIRSEAADFWETQPDLPPNSEDADMTLLKTLEESEFDSHFGLLTPEQTVLIRAYSDDTDDRLLVEIQPRFIIMFEPNIDFVRRIEVYRSAHPGMGVRVYHMVYGNSCEEHKYLAGIRKEKEAFEKLIKERGSMLMPLLEETREGAGWDDKIIKTISSRVAGGRKELNTEPSTVIVDMREFGSTLPSLLHASNLLVVPATLTVGDYILTPDICVERKSLPDLVSSFNSGRLYTQCEVMSAYYKHPILLIEFEEDKAFFLEIPSQMKSYVKSTAKCPPKKKPEGSAEGDYSAPSIQSKIVLLTLSFPRVRIIWSSSPYATADIFKDLKLNNAEPDATAAITVGADSDPDVGAGVNAAAEELLRCLPGITIKNVGYVMNKIRNVTEFCEMNQSQVQDTLGVEPGKACYEFMHRGDR
ncbi:hypothetical protein BDQ12DRAFT_683398 [Crucibulum laeve]|uniref:ERCC4 domain-containing protein n=1 Tax=Crucibulum laeve TaxID=68775 RepID=A0A5C3MCD7_9AGAR|nr:hypothetical protein BDQ12DRAFT_683398 [Crucibulum laeve]